MLKREITYEDYNGEEVTDTLYFNLSTTELLQMEASYDGGISKMLERIIEEQDIRKIIAEFKKILLASYGQRSENGKRFIKNDEIRTEFEQSAAFDALFMELAEDPTGAAKFVTGIIPKKLQDASAAQGNIPSGTVQAVDTSPVD